MMCRIHLSAPAESQMPESCTALQAVYPKFYTHSLRIAWHADKLCLVFKALDRADKRICSTGLFLELRPKSAMSCCT